MASIEASVGSYKRAKTNSVWSEHLQKALEIIDIMKTKPIDDQLRKTIDYVSKKNA